MSEEDRDAQSLNCFSLLLRAALHDGWMDVKVRNSRLSRRESCSTRALKPSFGMPIKKKQFGSSRNAFIFH